VKGRSEREYLIILHLFILLHIMAALGQSTGPLREADIAGHKSNSFGFKNGCCRELTDGAVNGVFQLY